MNSNKPKRKNQVRKMALLIVQVIIVTILFYFWERYLKHHFLGTLDVFNRPIIKSATGFHFFWMAWPVWSFPMLVTLWAVLLYKWHRSRLLRQQIQLIEQHRTTQQLQLNQLQDKLQQHDKLESEWELSQAAYNDLLKDYQRSTDFIEKLLDKLAKNA